VISPNSLQISKNWWIQFPYHLRLITKIRFYAAFGAGGVIYLTSLIFNNIGLSATDIGLGFTISAIIGTVTRLLTGNYLNKTGKIQFPIVTSSILSIAASLCLIFSRDTFLYLIGQSFVGAAAGIYWPAAEFGVPYFCHPIETRKAYALVRSSEALGIFIGVFLGGYMTNFLYSKSIFINDIFCMLVITYLISRNSSSIKKKIINAPISIGELVDKITILEIKKNKLQNSKLENVLKELSFLRKLMEKHQIEITDDLFTQLKEINLTLWNIEDQIRIKEKNKEFDNIFIELARSVYFKNDKRAEIKKK